LKQFPHRALFCFASPERAAGSEYLEHTIVMQACVTE
jgi:hypothetical protein